MNRFEAEDWSINQRPGESACYVRVIQVTPSGLKRVVADVYGYRVEEAVMRAGTIARLLNENMPPMEEVR